MSNPYTNEPYPSNTPPSYEPYPSNTPPTYEGSVPPYAPPTPYPSYPYPAPPPYGQPYGAYQQPYMMMAPVTNGMAIASLVCAFVFPILGAIFGHIALGQIKRSNGMQTGHGLAVAGLIVSYISIAIGVLWVIFWIVLFVLGVAASTPTS